MCKARPLWGRLGPESFYDFFGFFFKAFSLLFGESRKRRGKMQMIHLLLPADWLLERAMWPSLARSVGGQSAACEEADAGFQPPGAGRVLLACGLGRPYPPPDHSNCELSACAGFPFHFEIAKAQGYRRLFGSAAWNILERCLHRSNCYAKTSRQLSLAAPSSASWGGFHRRISTCPVSFKTGRRK